MSVSSGFLTAPSALKERHTCLDASAIKTLHPRIISKTCSPGAVNRGLRPFSKVVKENASAKQGLARASPGALFT